MIELKKAQLNQIYEILDKFQLNKITNANVRKSILKLVLLIPKKIEEIAEDINKATQKYFSEFKNDDLLKFQSGLDNIKELLRENKTIEANAIDLQLSSEFPDIVKAYKSFNADLIDMDNEIIRFEIEKINLDDFVDASVGQPVDISTKELNILNPILNNEFEN